jgi:epoxyqueuosine reductase
MTPTLDLLESLRVKVKAAGIDLFGVTSAEPLPVQDGFRHQQPRDLLPTAQSVVAAGYCIYYEPRIVAPEPGKPRGRFTAYGSRVFEQMERFCTDVISGCLRDRGFAAVAAPRIPIKPAIVRAGLGKYGRHSVVVTEELGSMVMFACVVTDAPLESGNAPIHETQCPRNCTLCIDACPTGAITGPYEIDRARCITNWLWGTYAPADLRVKQENRLFGCAECLKACPKNKHVRPRGEYPIPTDGVNDSPELIPLLTGDLEYFKQVIPTFPMRAGIDNIRGNAVIALGNIGDPAAAEGLGATLAHAKPQLRAYSAWALGRIATDKARGMINAARARESDPMVIAEMDNALSQDFT